MRRNLKRIVSIVLVAVMVLSTMAIATVSAFAESMKATYTVEVSTSGSDGCTADMIYLEVIGEINGEEYSTDYHYCAHFGYHKTDRITFSDDNIGSLQGVTVKKAGVNGWYPNYFRVTKTVAGKSETVTVYGGKWVENTEPVTFSKDDNVYKVDMKTSNEKGAGTDSNVYFSLIDKKDKETTSLNASSIHPSSNAFEKGDFASFYVSVPDYFGKMDKIRVELGAWTAGAPWKLEYFNVTKVSGTEDDLNVTHTSTVNQEFEPNSSFAWSL